MASSFIWTAGSAAAGRGLVAAATKHSSSSSSSSGSILFGAATAVTASSGLVAVHHHHHHYSECESEKARQTYDKKQEEARAKLRTRMTSVGHFSLASQTDNNPSVSSFFMTLVGDKPGFTPQDFKDLWEERGIAERHPRFHQVVAKEAPGHFEPETKDANHVIETFFPYLYRRDIQSRIESMQTEPLDVHEKTWEVQIASSGPVGQSGGVPASKSRTSTVIPRDPTSSSSSEAYDSVGGKGSASASASALSNNQVESILFFRGHHALGDGVSLFTAILDLCDEAEEFREAIKREIKKRFQRRGGGEPAEEFVRRLKKFVMFWIGCLYAMLYQGQLHLLSLLESNPLKQLQKWAAEEEEEGSTSPKRTISFSMAAPVDEVKWVAQTLIGKKATVNDVFVSCVSFAIIKQVEEHRQRMGVLDDIANEVSQQQQGGGGRRRIRHRQLSRMSNMNIVMPVHLYGGVMLPGQSLGNRIGAMVARVPGEGDWNSGERLKKVHDTLYQLKQTPTPLLSYLLVRLTSSISGTFLPNSWTQSLFSKANANAAAVVTNVRGPPKPLHVKGRLVKSVHGFVPLPPGIPIGVVVSSYAGTCKLSLSAEPWAVPDGDRFLVHVLEEYQSLLEQAKRKAGI